MYLLMCFKFRQNMEVAGRGILYDVKTLNLKICNIWLFYFISLQIDF